MSRADLRFDRGSNPPLRMGSPNKADGIGGQADQQWGRCRGGFGTKIHAAVNGLGLPVGLTLTPGQATDVTQAKPLIEGLPFETVIADKTFDSQKESDSQTVVAAVEDQGGETAVPSRRVSASKVSGVMNAVSVDSSSAGRFSVRGGLGTDGATRCRRRVDCQFWRTALQLGQTRESSGRGGTIWSIL